ncbi:MAG: 5-formyltetrahydrofolate cyclo-ligase [Janthinobacterium sp.]|jgi:5-formyltetrahydrofolate cyclo-ligase
MTRSPRIARNPTLLVASAETGKADLRRALLALRAALDIDTRRYWDSALCAAILAWWHAERTPKLGVYWPLRGEPNLQPAYTELAAQGVQLSLPVVLEKDAPLVFASWQPGEAMTPDRMGVPVPAQLRLLPCPPALLVPCVGYNPERLRLGYGGGFYDRTLACAPRPTTIGITYACMAAQFDGAAHDIALDHIMTEAGLLQPEAG